MHEGPKGRDSLAVLTIVIAAVAALGMAWFEPWWRMEARAPQYGKQTLVVEISPLRVVGDVKEIDTLGHYVGIRPLRELAHVERALAPFGLALAIAGLTVAPFVRRRRLRLLAVLPALVMPELFLLDLNYWMQKSVNDRDPTASLSRTVPDVDPKLAGRYDVGQFKVEAILAGGFFNATIAGILALGLVFATPISLPERLRRKRALRAVTTALAGVWLMAQPFPAEAGELADRIAAARPGDTVIVPAGVSREHLLIDKPLTLRGVPGAVIDGSGAGTIVSITSANVTLRGLTLRNSGDSYVREDSGIKIENAAGVRIHDVKVLDTLFGIYVAKGDGCVIDGSTVVGKDLPHVRRGDGIRLWYSSGCTLTGNTVERSRDVIVWYSKGTRVERNVVRTSRYGLHYMYSDDNSFRDNRFEDNQVGAAIMYSRGVSLVGNSFSFSNGPAAYGLLVKDADDIEVSGNRFLSNSTALFFDNAPQARDGWVRVTGNLVARNEVGVGMLPMVRRIAFGGNAFVGNRTQVRVSGEGSAGGNDWSPAGRGNYWSEAVVYDEDGDGVSDIPYRVESTYEGLSERHPTLAFFDGSPGAQAIDDAARLFPIFAPRPKLTDAHPLMRPPLSEWSGRGESRRSGLALAGSGMLAATGFLFRLSRSVL